MKFAGYLGIDMHCFHAVEYTGTPMGMMQHISRQTPASVGAIVEMGGRSFRPHKMQWYDANGKPELMPEIAHVDTFWEDCAKAIMLQESPEFGNGYSLGSPMAKKIASEMAKKAFMLADTMLAERDRKDGEG